MQMTGNTILITGGSAGIGRGLAEAFLALGNEVIIAGRQKAQLEETVQSIPGLRPETLDVGNGDAVRRFADILRSRYPKLNVLIHCAGIMRWERLQDGDIDGAEQTFSVNLLGTMRLTAALLPQLKAQARAAVMTVSSGLAFVPMALTPSYSASKAAVHSYTQSLRYQLQGSSVQVLELIPPKVQTNLEGPGNDADPHAMPLADFIAETMQILKATPRQNELCVERVRSFRFAEANGVLPELFKQLNDARAASRN